MISIPNKIHLIVRKLHHTYIYIGAFEDSHILNIFGTQNSLSGNITGATRDHM